MRNNIHHCKYSADLHPNAAHLSLVWSNSLLDFVTCLLAKLSLWKPNWYRKRCYHHYALCSRHVPILLLQLALWGHLWYCIFTGLRITLLPQMTFWRDLLRMATVIQRFLLITAIPCFISRWDCQASTDETKQDVSPYMGINLFICNIYLLKYQIVQWSILVISISCVVVETKCYCSGRQYRSFRGYIIS